jgi:hypothetical protein
MLVADLAVVIAMAIVETRLAHGVLPGAGISVFYWPIAPAAVFTIIMNE